MLVWSGGTISGCVLRRVQQVRNVWSSWWWWWKESGSEQQSPLSRSQDLLILVSEQLKFSVLVSSREFLNKRESCIQEEVCVKCQSANWEQRWWALLSHGPGGFFYLFLSVGLKFLFCLSRSVISTETEEDERFRVSSPRAGRPILIAAYFHQRQKDAAEEVQLGFKPRTTRGTYCTSSSDTEVLISISVFHPQIVTQ